MMTQNVKQVQVGKHSFPLYSHPAIRETAGTEAYVERVVQKHQNSPRVRNSVNYVARKLRQIGAMKTLNPEEHQVGEETSCAKSARTDRKHSYSPSPFEGRIPAALKNAKRNSEICKTPMGKLQAPCSPTVCGYPLPYPRSLSHNLFNVIQDTRRKGKTNTEQSELKNEGDPLTLSPIVPKVDTSPATESKGRRREEKPLAHEGQLLKHKLDVWRDLFLASAAQQLAASGHPRSRRDDAGNVFYSNISCYLKEGCIVKSEDTDLRTGPRDHLRVQGAYLSHLAPEAFANLHVTLDGNTFVLRNVQRTSPTIKQISEELCEERGIRLLPTAMQKKVAYLVSQEEDEIQTRNKWSQLHRLLMNKSAKKKGLSMEEKVSRIETWFVNNPSPYTLKDLIQILPKATGVIPQSVEECMEILVSENRVRQKKVGVHVLFWRFPQTATQRLAGSMGEKTTTTELAKYLSMSEDELRTELQTLKKTEKDIRQRIKETQASIGDDNAVQKDAEQIRSLQGEVKILEEQLNQLALLDPAFVEKLKAATVVAWESANRWTDNMYLLEQHISRKMGMSARELRAQLQLPLEVEYIEYDELLPSATSGGKSACTSSGNSCASPLICTVDATHGGGDSQEVPAAFHIEEGHTQNINEEAGEALTEGGCDVKPHEDVENETSNTLRKEKDGKKRGRGRPPLENAKKDDNMVNAPSVKKKKNEKDRPPAASNTDALTPARQRRCRR